LTKLLLSRYCTFTSLQEAKTAAAINLKFIADNELSDSFSEFEVVMRLFITLPTGISSAEKSFSVLRRIKNYLRSTMEQERISDLALLESASKVAGGPD